MTDCTFKGTAVALFPASENSTTNLILNNVAATCANIIATSSKINVSAVNCDFNASSAILALTSVTATPALLKLDNCSQSGAGVLVTRDGSQAIRVRGTDIPVDQTLLTPSDGDMIYNSNATPGNGLGVALYNTAAAKWKNLYSGLTN
jgi:hypothetical protein